MGLLARAGQDQGLDVPAGCVEGELRRRAAGFRGRGGQRVRGQQEGRDGGGGEGEAFSGAPRGRRRGGKGPGEEGRSGPVVFEDLDRQRGDQGQQPVCDVSQNQLLVSVATDTNVGGASLEEIKTRQSICNIKYLNPAPEL